MKKILLILSILLNLNLIAQNRLFSRLYYLKPPFHNSLTRVYPKKFVNCKLIITNPEDKRNDYIGESVYKRKKVIYYKDFWNISIQEILTTKINNDLKTSGFIGRLKMDTSQILKIEPIIEVFYPDVRGIFWGKSFAKVRLKMKVFLNDKLIIENKYESFYITNGNDDEWEGKTFETIENGANITIGICLRKTLDKFYKDLYEIFNK